MEKKNLKTFLKEKNITTKQFSEVTGVSVSTICRAIAQPDWNVRADTAQSIWEKTLEVYGEGLCMYDWLNK